MDAITLENEKAIVKLNRCIGCGNCVPTCGMRAMKLYKKGKKTTPPKSSGRMYTKMMIKKRGFLGTIKMLGNMLFRRKI